MVGILLHLSGPTEGIDVASHDVNLETNSLSKECGCPVKKLYCVAINYERLDGCFLGLLSVGICRRNVC